MDVAADSTSYDIEELEEDSSYSITVRATNDVGSIEITITEMTMEAGRRYDDIPMSHSLLT